MDEIPPLHDTTEKVWFTEGRIDVDVSCSVDGIRGTSYRFDPKHFNRESMIQDVRECIKDVKMREEFVRAIIVMDQRRAMTEAT